MPKNRATSTPPAWAVDRPIRQRAYSEIRPYYGRYRDPYAAVTVLYKNMGGRIMSQAERARRAAKKKPKKACAVCKHKPRKAKRRRAY